MTTYFITFANIFEAAAFRESIDENKVHLDIHYFNYKACSLTSTTRCYDIESNFDKQILSKDSIVRYKQVRKGVTRYPILKF